MVGKQKGSKKVVLAALVGNICIATLKFTVALVTKSSALMAEAFHSMADSGNQALLIFGLQRSLRPPDKRHPFGYGKAQYFWSFVVANMLFMGGAVASWYEGINKIQHPHPLERTYLIYLVLGISMVIEGVVFLYAVREFLRRKTHKSIWSELKGSKDSNLIVVLLEDSAALVGLIIAFLGTLMVEVTGILVFDAVASILIGVILAAVALFLANEVRKLLIGESASEENLKRIRNAISDFSEVKSFGELYTMHLGPENILLAVDIDFEDDITASDLEEVIDRLEQGIRDVVPEVKQIFIEADGIKSERVAAKEGKNASE